MNNRMRHFVLKLMCDDAGCEDISELAGFAFYKHKQEELDATSYLTFSSAEPFTLRVYGNKQYWDGTLYYSTDAITWKEWNGTVINSANNRIYIRGIGNRRITGDDVTARWVLTGNKGNKIECDGNIENLLDYETVSRGEHPVMGKYCYAYMFGNCTSLTTAPELPATTLTECCYNHMFSNCTSLTKAPELPAMILKEGCYMYMFYYCTSLTQAPELPATTLAESCYNAMFRECVNLTQAPELPATTLAGYCYDGMFILCTSLIQAPALPATTLVKSCYDNMFNGCTRLITVPALPATTLAEICYSAMFYGCTNIKLSTTKTGEYQTPYRIPTSGAGTTATNALRDMFRNTSGTFTGTPSINTTYYTSNEVV